MWTVSLSCPFSLRSSFPVAESQRRIIASLDSVVTILRIIASLGAVATILPSGEKAIEEMTVCGSLASRPNSIDVPNNSFPVAALRQDRSEFPWLGTTRILPSGEYAASQLFAGGSDQSGLPDPTSEQRNPTCVVPHKRRVPSG